MIKVWVGKSKKLSEIEHLPEKYSLLKSDLKNIPIDSNSESKNVILHFKPLREKIEEMLLTLPNKEMVGIYLQELNMGGWMGINEKQGFIPASLLKIPIAMAIMKKVDLGEIKLDQEIAVIETDLDVGAGVVDRYLVGDKRSYEDLLKLMIKVSDNTAKNILKRQLSPEEINSVFTHVGIDNPYYQENSEQLVTPRAFSRLFKALYYSTYLSLASSEKILEFATETRAESLIAAGIPWEIQVAHKYGERFDLLHDCGIVYYPENPYILCIMTSGLELTQAQSLIKRLSQGVFSFVSSENTN